MNNVTETFATYFNGMCRSYILLSGCVNNQETPDNNKLLENSQNKNTSAIFSTHAQRYKDLHYNLSCKTIQIFTYKFGDINFD